ncbi:MAG: hypothetical protein FJ186_03650 [Gammaproteobacteria bacterium]|jgi:hypothetical protein|nr:hypothetical protein [Gammaproteobacteria bacterium]
MDQVKFKRYQHLSALLPIGLFLMVINAFFPLVFFEFELSIWIIPPCVTIGFMAYLIWFYHAYKDMYHKTANPLFYPSIATLIAHLPILSFICMPITYKEIWFHLNNGKLSFQNRLFIAWLYLNAIILTILTYQEAAFTISFWIITWLINYSALYFLNRELTNQESGSAHV